MTSQGVRGGGAGRHRKPEPLTADDFLPPFYRSGVRRWESHNRISPDAHTTEFLRRCWVQIREAQRRANEANTPAAAVVGVVAVQAEESE